MIIIEDSYSGSMIGKYHIVDNKVFTTLKNEKLTCVDGLCHDYNWHFAFGIKNTYDQDIDVEIYINDLLEVDMLNYFANADSYQT